jgi:hypothetical protein
MSRTLFDSLTGNDTSLVDFMRRSPLYGDEDIQLERDTSLTRELAL